MFKEYFFKILDYFEERRKNKIIEEISKNKIDKIINQYPLLFQTWFIFIHVLFRLLVIFALLFSAFLFNDWNKCKMQIESCSGIESYSFVLLISLLFVAFFDVLISSARNPKEIWGIASKKYGFEKLRKSKSKQ